MRGKAAGDVTDEKLPRALHVGFLGDDPASPELKTTALPGALSLCT